MSKYLGRDAFLAKAKAARRYMDCRLPSGGVVRLQSLSEFERSNYERGLLNKKGDGANPNALLASKRAMVVLCMVDEEGNRVLSDNDINALASMDSADIDHICTTARKHCGFDDADFEALVGNSEAAPAECSPSA